MALAGQHRGMPSAAVQRARRANTLVFFMTGAVYAAWATRIPAVKERLGLSDGELGLAILGLEAGAIVGLPAGAGLVARFGSRAALRAGFVVYPAALVGVAFAPGLPALALALGVMAAGSSVVDVAMNAQGVELERRYGRPVLSGMHAGHPFGLVAGGLAGSAAAAASVSVHAHLAVAAAVGLVVGVGATLPLVPESRARRAGRPRLTRPLALLGVVAFCAFLLDGAAYNWSAVHLRAERDAGPGLAAVAFTTFSLALALGRLRGDRLVARFGRVRVVQGGGLAELSSISAALGLLVGASALMALLAAPALGARARPTTRVSTSSV